MVELLLQGGLLVVRGIYFSSLSHISLSTFFVAQCSSRDVEDLFEVVGEPDAPVEGGEGEDEDRDQGLTRRSMYKKDKLSITAIEV